MIVDSNFDLEIGHFFLCTGPSRRSSVGNLINRPVKFTIAVGVDLHVRLIANFHIHDVVLVHVHSRFHVIKVRHAHDFRPSELSCRHNPLTKLAV